LADACLAYCDNILILNINKRNSAILAYPPDYFKKNERGRTTAPWSPTIDDLDEIGRVRFKGGKRHGDC
jgi:hypothetical protein